MIKSDILFLFVLALVPIQLGKFFFIDQSFILGLPIDYRAPALYLTDIVVFFYLLSVIIQPPQKLVKILRSQKKFIISILALNIYLLISNLIFSSDKITSFWFLLKITHFSLFAIFASYSFSRKTIVFGAQVVITISLIWQSALIILQFIFQRSLGLWILGERSFDSNSVGIAVSQFSGFQLLRPYGTFPHPNVAGAFLIFGAFSLFLHQPKAKLTPFKIILGAVVLLAIIPIFSKAALLILAVVFLSRFALRRQKKMMLVAIIIFIFIFFQLLLPNIQIASIAERLVLSQAALDIALTNPFFGIGSNNFILSLSTLNLLSLSQTRLLQPVHNVFLLILAENGIFGLLFFASVLIVVAQKTSNKLKTIMFLAILGYFSVDHFLWTLEQGQLILWLTIGYILSPNPGKKLS